MKKIFWLLALLFAVGTYLHYVRGWDWERARRLPGLSSVFKAGDSATTTPIGQRGTGTHWETLSPMPDARSSFGAALVDDTIYVIGGFDGWYRSLTSVLAYDIQTDTWRQVASLPQALHHPAVATDGKKIFVAGGFTGFATRPLDSAYAYDPLRDAWEELGRLNDFRGDAASVFVGSRWYVLGGMTTAGRDAIVEYYDFEKKGWNGLKSLSVARRGLAVAALGSELYALGGRNGSDDAFGTMEIGTGDDEWKKLQDLPTPRSAHAAAVQGGKVYVFGGLNKKETVATTELFDPKTGAWSTFAPGMPHPRQGLSAVSYKNRIYLLGGGRRAGFAVSDLNEVLVLEEATDRKK